MKISGIPGWVGQANGWGWEKVYIPIFLRRGKDSVLVQLNELLKWKSVVVWIAARKSGNNRVRRLERAGETWGNRFCGSKIFRIHPLKITFVFHLYMLPVTKSEHVSLCKLFCRERWWNWVGLVWIFPSHKWTTMHTIWSFLTLAFEVK